MATTTRTVVRTRTEVYVGGKIAYAMQVILTELGLGALSRAYDWSDVERALGIWLGEAKLSYAKLEIYQRGTSRLLATFDVDIDYSVGEPSMRHDAELSRLAARKVALQTSGSLSFRVILGTKPGARHVDGWSSTTLGDASGLRKRTIGELARGPGIGSELGYRV
jgi:hypothetical protein